MRTNHEGPLIPLVVVCDQGLLPDKLYVSKNLPRYDWFDNITTIAERALEFSSFAREFLY